MNVRSSRLATDLEAAANAAKDPFEAACLRADLAAQWARLGRVEEADLLLSSLRERFKTAPHPRLTPWLNYAESMINLRRHRVPEAMVKMHRAHALAIAGNVNALSARAAATLAHMYWNAQELEPAVSLIQKSLLSAHIEDLRSRCASSLLLGEMLAISGQVEAGKVWFNKCRQYASATGDMASLSALNFNLSVVALTLLTQRKFELPDEAQSPHEAQAQWAASSALDEMFAIATAEGMSLLQTAQLHSVAEKPELALIAYGELERAHLASSIRQKALWLADQAWCEMRLGKRIAAMTKASSAIDSLSQFAHLDDLAVTHSSLALVFEAAGDDRFAYHRQTASKFWSQYRAVQSRTAKLCLAIKA